MAEYMTVKTGLDMLNEFLSSTLDRLRFASKARKQYYEHISFGSCPHETFKTISNFIDKLIKRLNHE